MESLRDFIIFGASGNLASEKIYPALYGLFKQKISYRYWGFGRKEFSSSQFRQLVKRAVLRVNKVINESDFNRFIGLFNYRSGSYNQAGLAGLKKVLKKPAAVFYLSLPSFYQLVSQIVSGLKTNHLLSPTAKLVIEKPFGFDYSSAQKLNRLLQRFLKEDQIYRIDHYLAKDLIKDLITLRFANPIFEAVFNRQYVQEIKIEILEKIGIKNRGESYDQIGAIRDIIQNHGLQLLALTTMDQPQDLKASSLHQAKAKVLSRLRLFGKNRASAVKIGQYRGYQQEENIRPGSLTETSAVLRSEIDNDRWWGVPISLITAKKMARKCSEVTVLFKKPVRNLWDSKCGDLGANALVINIHPANDIRLKINSGLESAKSCPGPISLRFSFADNRVLSREPYQNVLGDLYQGERGLFLSSREILLAWRFLDPILKYLEPRRKKILRFY